MLKLNRLLLTTLCTAAIPFSALAEAPAKPLMLEELPAQAILRVNKTWGGYNLLADGTELRLSEDKRSVEIRKFSQVRRLELPGVGSHLGSKMKGVVQIMGAYDQATQGTESFFVHLKSGKVYRKAANEKAYLSNIADSVVISSATSYESIDEQTGDLKFLKSRANAQNGVSYSSNRTSIGHIVTIEGTMYRVEGGRWSEIPAPAGFTSCSDQDEAGVLDCGGEGSRRLLLYAHGDDYIKWEYTGKTVLAFHRERHEAIWVNEISSADVKLVANLNVTRLDTNTTRQVAFRTHDPKAELDFFFRMTGNNYAIWAKNKELSVVSRDEFWAAFDAKKLHGLTSTGRKLGRARSIADLGPLLQGEYQAIYASRTDGDWQVGVRDGVFSYGPAGTKALHRVFLGSEPGVSVIPRTPFALLQFRVGSNSFNVLYNLELHRAFELGAGYASVEVSERGDQILLSRNSDEWLIALGLTNTNPNWRNAPTMGMTRGELGDDVLGSCTVPELPSEQGIAAALMRLRQMPSQRVDEHDLRHMLSYQLTQGELVLVAQILQKWVARKPDEAMLVFRRLKLAERLLALKPGFKTSPCLDAYDLANLKTHVTNLFKEAANNNVVGIDIYGFQHLVALQPLVREFGFDNSVSEDVIVEKIAKAAELHPQLQGVFPSKLYYFAKAIANPIFGRVVKFKTDVTVNQDKKVSHVTLMSTVPAYGQPVRRNSLGFYHGVISSMEVTGDVGAKNTQRFEWRALGQKFAADVTLTKSGDLSHLVPASASVDFAALNQDRKLVGMMVVGTNMGYMHSAMTMSQYESFYKQHGYQFAAAGQTPNSLKFMEEKIASGELDYLVKEAHSDGDERNLFRAARVGELRVGRKVHPDSGREQIVYLLAPKYGSGGNMETTADGSDDLIPNQLFGDWIRAREAAGRGPLVYLNASCSSSTKVVNEITATRSKLLVAIPSVTAISMFRNRHTNSTAVFLEGLHEGLDWASIRKRMEIDPEVKEERNNLFAMPNEERFDRSIRQSLGFTVDSDVKLTDLKLNRSFSVDEFNRDH